MLCLLLKQGLSQAHYGATAGDPPLNRDSRCWMPGAGADSTRRACRGRFKSASAGCFEPGGECLNAHRRQGARALERIRSRAKCAAAGPEPVRALVSCGGRPDLGQRIAGYSTLSAAEVPVAAAAALSISPRCAHWTACRRPALPGPALAMSCSKAATSMPAFAVPLGCSRRAMELAPYLLHSRRTTGKPRANHGQQEGKAASMRWA